MIRTETSLLFVIVVAAVSYVLIITEKVHRTVAALGGASILLLFGRYFGLIPKEKFPSEIHFMAEAVDWNTIGLLFGMMVIVGILKETGVFEFLAIKAAKVSNGDPWKIMLLFSIITAILSAFLDNVTTVLLIAPITISITKSLKLKPVPFLIAEVITSNIGGASTLIGDPPNIIISSGAGLSFNEFIINMGPPIFVALLVTLVFIKFAFRKDLSQKPKNIEKILQINEWDEIKDYTLLKKSLFVLFLVIVLFFLHSKLNLEPATVAISGAVLLLLLSAKHIDNILNQVEWSVLLFFVGLFVIVKGLDVAGLLDMGARAAVGITGGNLAVAMFVILFTSAIASSIVDNIPFTATMVPVVHSISANPMIAAQITQVGSNPLWWALGLGACLGGNGTLIGASANVVVAGISEKMGYPISFKEFLKYGIPVTFITVITAGVILYARTFII